MCWCSLCCSRCFRARLSSQLKGPSTISTLSSETTTPELRAENPSLSLTQEQIVERYATKLKKEGVVETEITRRTRLLLTERSALEADYWNRYYLDSKSNFNRAPNDFLRQIAAGLRPGVALDYGMGEGRNAIYLASLGWEVWGFDPANAGVELA